MKPTRLLTLSAVVMAASLTLVACSSETSNMEPSPSNALTPTTAPEGAPVGVSPSTWSPQMVEPGTHSIFLEQFITLEGIPQAPAHQVVVADTSDENVIWVTQSGPGSYVMVNAKGLGNATVKVWFADATQSDRTLMGQPVATYEFNVEPHK